MILRTLTAAACAVALFFSLAPASATAQLALPAKAQSVAAPAAAATNQSTDQSTTYPTSIYPADMPPLRTPEERLRADPAAEIHPDLQIQKELSAQDGKNQPELKASPLTFWEATRQPTMRFFLIIAGGMIAIFLLRRWLRSDRKRNEDLDSSSLGKSDDEYYAAEMRERRNQPGSISPRDYRDQEMRDYRNDFTSTTGGGSSKAQFQMILPNAADKNTFADVAGQPEAIARLKEVCHWLKEPEVYNRHDAQLPRGILLVGPPGTGKTLLARALAGEADASMLITTGSSFVEMYVGVGASRVRALFEDARTQRKRSQKPVLIFIDEIDAVGGARGNGNSSNSEREQTLNQLLTEMDGFKHNEGIIVLAATNRSDMLDAALKRKGRFDLEVFVDLPDASGREAIFKVHSRKKKLAPTVDFGLIARRTFGFSGADIEAACNEAAVIAARQQSVLDKAARELAEKEALRRAEEMRAEEAKAAEIAAQTMAASNGNGAPPVMSPANPLSRLNLPGASQGSVPLPTTQPQKKTADSKPQMVEVKAPAELPVTLITTEMLDEAISTVEAGEARKDRFKVMSLADKQQTAFHELGHAVTTLVLKGDPITKITILPRGRALGYVQTHTESDRWNMTREQMILRITSAMAGRIAQEIFMNTVDTGASSDFQQANDMAKRMVTQFGMSKLGRIYLADSQTPVAMQVGPRLADAIDTEVQSIISECEDNARKLLKQYESQIRVLCTVLIERETLLGTEFYERWEALLKEAEKPSAAE